MSFAPTRNFERAGTLTRSTARTRGSPLRPTTDALTWLAERASSLWAVSWMPGIPSSVPAFAGRSFVDGRTTDAIQMLRRTDYASDAVAQLLLASLLSFERLHSDALAIYDRVLTLGDEHRHAALLGKAHALLESGRAEEALSLFERVSAERKDLTEALDGRARALKQLGRIKEADEAFKQYVAIAGQRSELRVRSR